MSNVECGPNVNPHVHGDEGLIKQPDHHGNTHAAEVRSVLEVADEAEDREVATIFLFLIKFDGVFSAGWVFPENSRDTCSHCITTNLNQGPVNAEQGVVEFDAAASRHIFETAVVVFSWG